MDETEAVARRGSAWLALAAAVLALALVLGLFAGMVADFLRAVSLAGSGRAWFPVWSTAALGGLLVLELAVGTVAYREGRAGRPAELRRVLQRLEDGRPFLLYLRPFAIERRLLLHVPMLSGIPYVWALPQVRLWLGLEPNLKRSIARFPSVAMVAIGELDDDPGVAKLTPTDADWQSLFVDLAGRAAGVFVVPFTSTGSLWELDWLFDHALGKTVFILPPSHVDPIVGAFRSHDFEGRWRDLQKRYATRADLPDYREAGAMLTLKPASAPNLTPLRALLQHGAAGLRPPVAAPGERWIPHTLLPLGQDSLDAAVDGLIDAGRLGGFVAL
jgi:hypothetical protein